MAAKRSITGRTVQADTAEWAPLLKVAPELVEDFGAQPTQPQC